MADDVDISIKLGAEADLTSAISAGARAGAAFAAAAQNAVSSISLSAAGTTPSFGTNRSYKSYITTTDLMKELRSASLTHIAIAQTLSGGSGNGGGGWDSKPFAPIYPQPGGKGNLPDNIWNSYRYSGQQRIEGPTSNVYDAEWTEYTEHMDKNVTNINRLLTKQDKNGGGSIGGGGYTAGSSFANNFWKSFRPGYIRQVQTEGLLRPLEEYLIETNAAEYRAHTERSAAGFRQESLAKNLAWNNMVTTYGSKAATLSLVGAGAALGGPVGAGITAILAGISHIVLDFYKKDTENKLKENLAQQEKTLNTALKRSYNASLYGSNYNTSYQEAIGNMGIGISEGDISTMSSNALTFRGRQAFGGVGMEEYTMLAQVPNYFAALNAEVTDPDVLHKLLAYDLNNIGDKSMAAYVASKLPGVGLGVYSALNNPAYWDATDQRNSNILKQSNEQANSVVSGYVFKNSQNSVLSSAISSAQNIIDASTAPDSFYNGVRPSALQKTKAEQDYEDAKQAVWHNEYTGNTYIINVQVDGDTIKTETVKERDFVMGGMSYTAGGN